MDAVRDDVWVAGVTEENTEQKLKFLLHYLTLACGRLTHPPPPSHPPLLRDGTVCLPEEDNSTVCLPRHPSLTPGSIGALIS